jgi:peptide deformylase
VVIFGIRGIIPAIRSGCRALYGAHQPRLTPLVTRQEEGWEGCLSVPGMRGLVPRYRHLRYTGVDERGQPIDRTWSDFHARVVQHEVDHLDGILYPRRIRI